VGDFRRPTAALDSAVAVDLLQNVKITSTKCEMAGSLWGGGVVPMSLSLLSWVEFVVHVGKTETYGEKLLGITL
jgi:hypothetical protein